MHQGCTKPIRARLIDKADGVRGHYCIGVTVAAFGGLVSKFWNEKAKKWDSAGTVYLNEQAAEKRLRELERA